MSELFSQLGINWKLLLAQVVNFLLVLWLLNRFVFRKLITFLEERQQRIQKGVEMRQQAERELGRIQEARHRELEKARKEAEVVIAKAKTLAQDKGREILVLTRENAEKIMTRGKFEAEKAKKEAVEESKEEINKLAILLAEKVLARKITEKDEENIVKEVLEEIQPT